MNILELKGVSKSREQGSDYRLEIPSFNIGEREYVAITGPSGCGKSTTLDMVGMILSPDESDVFALNLPSGQKDIAELWKKGQLDRLTELRRQNLGYVLQTGELFSFLTVRENIELAGLTSGKSRQEASKLADDLMNRLDIKNLGHVKPARLSIGQRQRAAIARAIAPIPKLLLADEPTAALDPGLAEHVMRLFLDTVKDFGSSVILVSHDLGLVHKFGFREVKISLERNGDHITGVLDDRAN